MYPLHASLLCTCLLYTLLHIPSACTEGFTEGCTGKNSIEEKHAEGIQKSAQKLSMHKRCIQERVIQKRSKWEKIQIRELHRNKVYRRHHQL